MADPAVEGFLALLAARRAPRTVDAYRRDLADLSFFLGRSPADATTGEMESWLADLRARGLARAARFTWARTAAETLRVYEEALTEAGGMGAEEPPAS
jgi:site-specific recombinase XerD